MKDGKSNKKRNSGDKMRLDEFFAEERFDEEDEDSVTDDTLEFLCLDDDEIESYQSEQKSVRSVSKSSVSQYEDDEELEDEDYEDEDYEDDEDDEDYEDEDYEDEDYEDEDEEYDEEDEYEYDDDEDGVFVRFKRFLAEMSTLDMIVAMLGIVVIAGVAVTSALFVNAKTIEKQVESFASVGEEVQGISVIGESGLVAVSESAKLSAMIDLEEEPEGPAEPDDEEQNKGIEVTLNLTSIQSDLKIKFVNKATGKLIGGVPFEVEVSNGKKTFDLRDDDKDGIIYQTGIEAGTYQVTAKPFKDGSYEDYKLPLSAASVKVTDTITYKKVDVADEVKSESEINAAKEDTAIQDMTEESALTDTVEWVESTKTPVDSNVSYKEINKDQIPDPATLSAAGGFMKMVNDGIMPLSEPTPTTPTCTCTSKCANEEAAQGANCDVCKEDYTKCRAESSPEPQEPSDEDKVNKLSLSATSLDMKQGDTNTLSIAGEYKPDAVTWSSDNDSVASVSSSGTVTANGAGDTTIKASVTIGGASKTFECKVKVTASQPEQKEPTDQEKLSKIALDKTSLSLTQGGTDTLAVTGEYVSSISSYTWGSSNDKVASVDSNGKVTAVAAGNADITVKIKIGSSEATLKCTVTVTAQAYKITKIDGSVTIKVGGTGTINVTTEPSGGTISWTSDNDKVAKIESSNATSATVKGVAAGTATITAKCGDSTATCKVTVVKDTAGDTTSKLKDKNGNQVYVYKDGKYVEAKYADYYTAGKFYLPQTTYRYTGWQTIDGSVYYFDKDGNYVTGDQVIQGARYTFGSDGKLSAGSGTMGIDVSKWNGNIDWNAVKNSGVSYVIIRCGYRGSSTGVLVEDPKFRSNIKGAQAAGLKVGVYFFSQAVNEVEAVEEASMALSLVSGYGLNYPIFLDVESSGGRGDGVSKETRTAVCKAFCQTIQNSGYSAGVYANKTWFTEKINTSSLTGYKIWLAQYASTPTYTATRYDMWQYSSKGHVSGISGYVDMNISYMNY